jgi:transcription antitermination factor NusG
MWAVLELTPWGEKEGTKILEKEIKKKLSSNEVEIFIPFLINPQGLEINLVTGYVFVETTHIDTNKLFTLENTKYIKCLLTENHYERKRYVRNLSFIDADYVEDLKMKFKELFKNDIKKNDIVYVRSGLYKHMEATVVSVDKQMISILIELRSVNLLVDLPILNVVKK